MLVSASQERSHLLASRLTERYLQEKRRESGWLAGLFFRHGSRRFWYLGFVLPFPRDGTQNDKEET